MYLRTSLIFFCAMWSLKGAYLFALCSFLVLAAFLFDDYRRLGMTGLRTEPFPGFAYYKYHATLLGVAFITNAVVYVDLLVSR